MTAKCRFRLTPHAKAAGPEALGRPCRKSRPTSLHERRIVIVVDLKAYGPTASRRRCPGLSCAAVFPCLFDTAAGATFSCMILSVELEREDDGRWLAEVPSLPGVMCYGQDRDEAVAKVQALALRVIAERLEHREAPAEFLNVTFKAA